MKLHAAGLRAAPQIFGRLGALLPQQGKCWRVFADPASTSKLFIYQPVVQRLCFSTLNMASVEPAAGSSSELSAEDHKPCHTCQVRFANSEVLLQHFGSQWHQYNVKRAASQLPPVTLTGFERKLAAAIQQREESALASRPRKFKCLVTGKVFNSIGQLQTHYAAKKTKSAISKQLKAGKLTEDPLKDFDFSALSNSHIPQCVKVIFLDGAEPPQPVIDSEHAKHMHDISQYSTVHDICFLDLQPVKDFEE